MATPSTNDILALFEVAGWEYHPETPFAFAELHHRERGCVLAAVYGSVAPAVRTDSRNIRHLYQLFLEENGAKE